MTSELKCPFCGGELDTENYYVHCHNPHCNTTVEMEGTEEMWEALTQAKQDLEIARKALVFVKTLNERQDGCFEEDYETQMRTVYKALEQISLNRN